MRALFVCAVGTGLYLTASGAETKVTLDQLPPAVGTAIEGADG
jgi:hypothetical protein